MFDFNKFNVYKVNMNTIINTKQLLTRREETAFLLVAQGKSVRDAARVMHISRATAYEYIENGKTKLHAETLPHSISLLWTQGYLRRVAAIPLFLAMSAPVRQAVLDIHDPLLRITQATLTRGRHDRRSRRNNTQGHSNHPTLNIDTDTGQLLWPGSEAHA